MATLSKTITNSINLFGGAPSSKWNAYNWNAFKWGEGTADLQVKVTKSIGNSLTLANTVAKSAVKSIGNTVAVTEDMGSQVLKNNDWTYNFVDRATDGEDRDFATWTDDTEEDTDWTPDSEEDTDWSE